MRRVVPPPLAPSSRIRIGRAFGHAICQLGQRIAQKFDSGNDRRRTLKQLLGHRRKRGVWLPDAIF